MEPTAIVPGHAAVHGAEGRSYVDDVVEGGSRAVFSSAVGCVVSATLAVDECGAHVCMLEPCQDDCAQTVAGAVMLLLQAIGGCRGKFCLSKGRVNAALVAFPP